MAFLPLSLTLTPPPHQLPPSSPSPLAFTLVWGVNANGSARYTNKINTEQVLVKDYCSLSVSMFVVCVCNRLFVICVFEESLSKRMGIGVEPR